MSSVDHIVRIAALTVAAAVTLGLPLLVVLAQLDDTGLRGITSRTSSDPLTWLKWIAVALTLSGGLTYIAGAYTWYGRPALRRRRIGVGLLFVAAISALSVVTIIMLMIAALLAVTAVDVEEPGKQRRDQADRV